MCRVAARVVAFLKGFGVLTRQLFWHMPRRKGIYQPSLSQGRIEVARMWMPPWGFNQPPLGAGQQLPPPMMGMMGMMHPQQMMSMAGMMGMHMQPHNGLAMSRDEQPHSTPTSASASGNIDTFQGAGKRYPMVDDPRKLSTSYKSLGLVWMSGEKRTTPKRFRASLCTACNDDEYPMVKVAQLDEEQVGLLLFVLAGILPSTKVSDMGAVTKGDAREAVRRQYQVKLRKNATRLSHLSEELDNLPMVALRMGYPAELFSPPLKKAYDEMRSVRMQSVSLGSPPSAKGLVALGGSVKPLQLTDASGADDLVCAPLVLQLSDRTAAPVPTSDDDGAEESVGVVLPKMSLPKSFARPSGGKRMKLSLPRTDVSRSLLPDDEGETAREATEASVASSLADDNAARGAVRGLSPIELEEIDSLMCPSRAEDAIALA